MFVARHKIELNNYRWRCKIEYQLDSVQKESVVSLFRHQIKESKFLQAYYIVEWNILTRIDILQ